MSQESRNSSTARTQGRKGATSARYQNPNSEIGYLREEEGARTKDPASNSHQSAEANPSRIKTKRKGTTTSPIQFLDEDAIPHLVQKLPLDNTSQQRSPQRSLRPIEYQMLQSVAYDRSNTASQGKESQIHTAEAQDSYGGFSSHGKFMNSQNEIHSNIKHVCNRGSEAHSLRSNPISSLAQDFSKLGQQAQAPKPHSATSRDEKMANQSTHRAQNSSTVADSNQSRSASMGSRRHRHRKNQKINSSSVSHERHGHHGYHGLETLGEGFGYSGRENVHLSDNGLGGGSRKVEKNSKDLKRPWTPESELDSSNSKKQRHHEPELAWNMADGLEGMAGDFLRTSDPNRMIKPHQDTSLTQLPNVVLGSRELSATMGGSNALTTRFPTSDQLQDPSHLLAKPPSLKRPLPDTGGTTPSKTDKKVRRDKSPIMVFFDEAKTGLSLDNVKQTPHFFIAEEILRRSSQRLNSVLDNQMAFADASEELVWDPATSKKKTNLPHKAIFLAPIAKHDKENAALLKGNGRLFWRGIVAWKDHCVGKKIVLKNFASQETAVDVFTWLQVDESFMEAIFTADLVEVRNSPFTKSQWPSCFMD